MQFWTQYTFFFKARYLNQIQGSLIQLLLANLLWGSCLLFDYKAIIPGGPPNLPSIFVDSSNLSYRLPALQGNNLTTE